MVIYVTLDGVYLGMSTIALWMPTLLEMRVPCTCEQLAGVACPAQGIEKRLLDRQSVLDGPAQIQRYNKSQAAALVAASHRLVQEQLPDIQLVAQVGPGGCCRLH
jgi:hypothetical protein